MKEFTAVIALTIIVIIMGIATLDALDKMAYPGCKVLSQTGQQLIIRIDQDLSPKRIERLMAKIRHDGYDPFVQTY